MAEGAEQQETQEIRPTINEVDLGHLVEVLDTVMSSNNTAVRDQLQKLLMIAALVSTDRPIDRVRGPISQILKDIVVLQDRVRKLERELEITRSSFDPNYEKMKNEVYN